MGRPQRQDDGGYAYHVLNRANGRQMLFRKAGDYAAFERVLGEALEHVPGLRLLSYCLMPNHWHLVLWPRKKGQLADFAQWLTLTHTQRWHAHYQNAGSGHLYQGRYKSFPIEADDHFLTVCRYVERNALRAGLVLRSELWRWCSLWRREQNDEETRKILSDWPVAMPREWVAHVNAPQTEAELESLRRCVQRGQPYGGMDWVQSTAKRLGLESTLRPRGRPKKESLEPEQKDKAPKEKGT